MESRFLPLIQALDMFTAADDVGKFISESEWKDVKELVVRAIPPTANPELQDAIKNAIRWRNQRDIKPRIRTLIESLDEATRDLFCRSPADFVEGLIDTRNYYTHYGDEAKERALNGLNLYWATEKAKLLARVILLKECGLTESVFRESLSRQIDASGRRRVWEKLPESLKRRD